jgi:fructose-1,6-bisphosphatase/inositol monophosphatase family enzyme
MEQLSLKEPMCINAALRLFLRRRGILAPLIHTNNDVGRMLDKVFEDTRQAYSEISSVPGRVNILVDIMKEIGQNLLEKRRYYQELVKNNDVHYATSQKVDSDITDSIRKKLKNNSETKGDRIILEDDDIPVDDAQDAVTWIGDGVDNTKTYLTGGEDYGSALMVIAPEGNVISSIYLMPAKATVYLAIPGKGVWRNGNPMDARQPVAIIRWPRNKNVVPPKVKTYYREIEKEFSENRCQVKPGSTLTALDVLTLAEGGPVKFAYYSKPWDFLIGAAIAHTAGAMVKMFDCEDATWKDLFPLNRKLRTNRNRVLFRVERE